MSQISPTSSYEFNGRLYKSYDEALKAKKRDRLNALPGIKIVHYGYKSFYYIYLFEYKEDCCNNPVDFVMNNEEAILAILREGR